MGSKKVITLFENLLSKSKNTSIEDKKLQGKVKTTFIDGEIMFEEK